MKALIIAGGLGKRLAPLTETVPKPMLAVDGRPILEHQLLFLRREGIKDIVMCTSHLSHVIEDYFGDGSEFGLNIAYAVEKEPLGTGGALKNAEPFIDGRFLALYGDLMVDMDLSRFVRFHEDHGSIGTLTVHPSDHPFDSDMVEADAAGRILRFRGKPKPGEEFTNLGNAGVYCFEQSILKHFPAGKSMLDREVLPSALERGSPLYAYRTDELVADIGTFERLGRYKK